MTTLEISAPTATAAGILEIDIVYLERQVERPATLSNLDPIPEDEGLMGAELGIADNNTTGRFLKQSYRLESVVVPPDGDFRQAAGDALARGRDLVVINAPAEDVVALADLPAARNALILNGGSPANRLRREDCRANVLHTLPSRSMLADALAQMLVSKRWQRWFLIAGSYPGDQAFAAALRDSAKKFGAQIVEDKTWAFDADMRRNAAQEVPLFTQGPDYDVLLVADETDDFGRYLPYNSFDPRPVAGTEGLSPRAWSPVVEQWGAAQLQNRFEELAGREMRPKDYAVWAAVRTLGEAVARTSATEATTLRDYIMSEQFELAAFKGRKLSFRGWNGQLRQPIPLVHPRALAALAPMEGFLHQRTELDTLGRDEPEAGCNAFQ